MLRLADFIEARCERFGCLCAHDDASLHVYDESEAKAEFGPLGWRHMWTTESGADYYGKTVEEISVTYQSRHAQVFTPSLPLL
jgi:tRNA isopentenyl-2-thiomethyl-A-37 hydroxylase MiaE